ARLPARLALARRGRRGTHGPHQLSAPVGHLHDDLLRARLRPFRPGRSGRPARDRHRHLDGPAPGVLRVALVFRRGPGGMADALARLQTAAELHTLVASRRRSVNALRLLTSPRRLAMISAADD